MKKQISAKIVGVVQGVGFRYFIYEKATGLKLDGWVRNNYNDNSVEVSAAGEEKDLLLFIEHLKKGPVFSRIDEVIVKWLPREESCSGFNITR